MHHARDLLESALDLVGEEQWQRKIPYGDRTLHELLAHLAGADQAWAVAAQGLLKGESEAAHTPLTQDEAQAARKRAIERGRGRPTADLRAEMLSRRKLLLGLYELLEKRHLALALPAYGDEHNSVRERIWLGYHDRLHADDVKRALRMTWEPPKLSFLPELRGAVDALSADGTLYVLYNVDPVMWERPSTVPGWTHRDLLAHVATGDWVFQLHLRSLIAKGTVATWPDVAAGNAERLAKRKVSTVSALIEEYLSMRHGTMLLLAELKEKHLREPMSMPWLSPPQERTVLDYVQWFWMHERAHREELRPAMKYATSLR
jgi:hypothetical protein